MAVFLCKMLGLVTDGMCFFSVSKPVSPWLNVVAVLKGTSKPYVGLGLTSLQ